MRFYKQKTPQLDDLVMVKIKQITELGVYVELLEYDNLLAFIQLSELSKGNHSLKKYKIPVTEGKIEICTVLSIDKNNNIDVSKRRVQKKEIAAFQEKYNECKTVHSILRHVSEVTNVEFLSILEKISWPLYEDPTYNFHAFNAFLMAIHEPEIFSHIEDAFMRILLDQIKLRLTPPTVKIKTEIQINCFTEEGIDAIKYALKEGEKVGTEENKVKIQLISSPDYIITTATSDVHFGISLLNEAIQAISKEIKKRKGKFVVKSKPSIYKDEEFTLRIQEIKKKNIEMDELNPDFIDIGGNNFIGKYNQNVAKDFDF
jgi:translation initiation factor 2 subunit 1